MQHVLPVLLVHEEIEAVGAGGLEAGARVAEHLQKPLAHVVEGLRLGVVAEEAAGDVADHGVDHLPGLFQPPRVAALHPHDEAEKEHADEDEEEQEQQHAVLDAARARVQGGLGHQRIDVPVGEEGHGRVGDEESFAPVMENAVVPGVHGVRLPGRGRLEGEKLGDVRVAAKAHPALAPEEDGAAHVRDQHLPPAVEEASVGTVAKRTATTRSPWRMGAA